ncbi:ROK family protein [candidate division KSB1 bacterium]|nr:ROK family protein [candidate division KSB1 bacterium]
MAKENKKYVVGVDLGGTKIYSAVIAQTGKIISSSRRKTKAESGFDSVVSRINKTIFLAIERAGITLDDILAVGIGSPGPLDLKEGTIINTPNLKWKNAPLKAELVKATGKPVAIDNDGNVGILGEYAYGAARNAKDVIGLFIGTGIGGGIIIGGRLLHGFNENAGELGHMILSPDGPKCGCGNKGCIEALASRLAIERDIRAAYTAGQKTKIFENTADSQERLRSKKLADAFFENDPVVKGVIERAAQYVGLTVASLLNIFNPQVVILGGGLVEAIGEPYVKIVRETAQGNVFPIAIRNVKIIAAELKDDSAVLGAAKLAWDMVEKS